MLKLCCNGLFSLEEKIIIGCEASRAAGGQLELKHEETANYMWQSRTLVHMRGGGADCGGDRKRQRYEAAWRRWQLQAGRLAQAAEGGGGGSEKRRDGDAAVEG